MAQGDIYALDELYARHGRYLLNFLIGQLGGDALHAEEVLQNVMLAAWKGAGNFRGESKVRTWLLAIARNQAINARRGKRFDQTELDEALADTSTGPFEALLRDDMRADLRQALLQLPQEQRETLELVFFHHMSGAEAAHILGVSEGTIKSRLQRAKETLRRLLENAEENPHA